MGTAGEGREGRKLFLQPYVEMVRIWEPQWVKTGKKKRCKRGPKSSFELPNKKCLGKTSMFGTNGAMPDTDGWKGAAQRRVLEKIKRKNVYKSAQNPHASEKRTCVARKIEKKKKLFFWNGGERRQT